MAISVLLLWGLFGPERRAGGVLVKTTQIDRSIRDFQLQRLYKNEQFASDSLRGKVWMLNVWASWCVACVQEHRVLQAMASENIAIYGLNYKDKPTDAKRWLAEHGNPYALIVMDNSKVSLDFGVYGVPESFLIDKKGVIRKKFTGPISWKDYQDVIKPMVKELEG